MLEDPRLNDFAEEISNLNKDWVVIRSSESISAGLVANKVTSVVVLIEDDDLARKVIALMIQNGAEVLESLPRLD